MARPLVLLLLPLRDAWSTGLLRHALASRRRRPGGAGRRRCGRNLPREL